MSQSRSDFCISSITYYEVGIGNRKSHLEYWQQLTEILPVIAFDKACSDNAIKIYVDLLKANKMIDFADILIGATAMSFNIPLATLNINHFERIEGLELFQ